MHDACLSHWPPNQPASPALPDRGVIKRLLRCFHTANSQVLQHTQPRYLPRPTVITIHALATPGIDTTFIQFLGIYESNQFPGGSISIPASSQYSRRTSTSNSTPILATTRSNRSIPPHMSGQKKHSKGSKYLSMPFHSASDPNLSNAAPGGSASGPSNSVQQGPQQITLPSPTPSRSRRFFRRLGFSSPTPPSPPLGVAPPNVSPVHHTITSASPSVFPRPHASHSQPSTQQIHGPLIVTASADEDVKDSTLAPVSTPPVSTPPQISTSPTSASPIRAPPASVVLVSAPEEIDVEAAKSPGVIKATPHSSVVWIQTLKIAEQKLKDNKLPPLDTTGLTSESAKENMGAVINSLNALREDKQKQQWSYTARDGRKVVFVERLGEILRSMEPYTKIVGTVIQHDPQVSALVWGGIQAIMQVRTYSIYHIVGL